MALFHDQFFGGVRVEHDGVILVAGNRGQHGGFSSAATPDVYAGAIEKLPRASTVTLAPAGHDGEIFALSVAAFLQAGFIVSAAELNYERSVYVRFAPGVSRGQLRCIEALEDKGHVVSEVDLNEYDHGVLVRNRQARGRKLTLGLDELGRQREAIPGHMVCFHVALPGYDAVAAAICMRVSPDVLYVWAWGDEPGCEGSPVTLLAKGIYGWCVESKTKLLDIGTAAEAGLMQFKSSLGFSPSLKLTMLRDA